MTWCILLSLKNSSNWSVTKFLTSRIYPLNLSCGILFVKNETILLFRHSMVCRKQKTNRMLEKLRMHQLRPLGNFPNVTSYLAKNLQFINPPLFYCCFTLIIFCQFPHMCLMLIDTLLEVVFSVNFFRFEKLKQKGNDKHRWYVVLEFPYNGLILTSTNKNPTTNILKILNFTIKKAAVWHIYVAFSGFLSLIIRFVTTKSAAEAYPKPNPRSTVDLFCENNWEISAVNYFCKKTPCLTRFWICLCAVILVGKKENIYYFQFYLKPPPCICHWPPSVFPMNISNNLSEKLI